MLHRVIRYIINYNAPIYPQCMDRTIDKVRHKTGSLVVSRLHLFGHIIRAKQRSRSVVITCLPADLLV